MNRNLTMGAAALIAASSIVAAVAPTTVLAQGRGGMGAGHASFGGGRASMGGEHASMDGGRASTGGARMATAGRFGFRGRDEFRGRFGFRGCCFGPGPFFAGVAIGSAWGYPYYPYGCARTIWDPYYGRYVVRYVC